MSTLGPLYTVHKDKCSDKRFSWIEDRLGRSFIKRRLNFFYLRILTKPRIKRSDHYQPALGNW